LDACDTESAVSCWNECRGGGGIRLKEGLMGRGSSSGFLKAARKRALGKEEQSCRGKGGSKKIDALINKEKRGKNEKSGGSCCPSGRTPKTQKKQVIRGKTHHGVVFVRVRKNSMAQFSGEGLSAHSAAEPDGSS